MDLDDSSPDFVPIAQRATAPWDVPLDYTDYNKLMKGFRPESMDDKWVCYTDKPNTERNAVIHMCRSWTGQEQVSLTIAVGNFNETKADDWAKITEISWDKGAQKQLVTEEAAKELATNLYKGLLKHHSKQPTRRA
jgi:hypothetical protein